MVSFLHFSKWVPTFLVLKIRNYFPLLAEIMICLDIVVLLLSQE